MNGAFYSEADKQAWEERRPLGVMVENSLDSRPQSGLSQADVIFEAVAEGGITRFLAVYYCRGVETVGPVRSARVYFLDFIGGFGNYPLYAHVGGANTPGPADALGQIAKMGWDRYNDLSQFSIGFPVFWRDYERLPGVATEHTMYSNTYKLWDEGAERGLAKKDKKGEAWDEGFQKWSFKDDAPLESRPSRMVVTHGFWENYTNFTVRWVYDKNRNVFVRHYGQNPHTDKNTDEPLEAKNVVVLFMDESVANDGYDQGQHLLYGTTGEGEAIVFQNGKAIPATWAKDDRFSQIMVYDEAGKEVEFVRGQIWFEVLPTGNQVGY